MKDIRPVKTGAAYPKGSFLQQVEKDGWWALAYSGLPGKEPLKWRWVVVHPTFAV